MKKLFEKFRDAQSPMFGIWILVVFGLLALFLLPYLFTRDWGLPAFKGTGEIGDTFNGIAGPFIALVAAVLTYLAFWVQYQANQQQRQQFEKQAEDQIFFKLMDTQESKVISSSFIIQDKEYKSYQLLEKILNAFNDKMEEGAILFSWSYASNEPAALSDFHLQQIFDLYRSNTGDVDLFSEKKFQSYKSDFLEFMKRYEKDFYQRNRYLEQFFGERHKETDAAKEVLRNIAIGNFYKTGFEKRAIVYRLVFDEVEKEFGAFLDGYLRAWEFIFLFIAKSENKQYYLEYLRSQFSKFERVIIFYYLASGYSNEQIKNFVKEYQLLNDVYFYKNYFLFGPDKITVENEVESIIGYKSDF